MGQIITATFERGVLKPDERLDLPEGMRVRLVVDSLDHPSPEIQEALDELDELCDQFPINSAGIRLTRDELHERRCYSLSHWDSMLIGACLEANVDTLYTEDMGSPTTIDGVQLVNPFI